MTRYLRLVLASSTFATQYVAIAGQSPTYFPTAAETYESLRPTEDDDGTSMQQFDAVIVGAGWAGIAATKTLLDYGVSNILVLEANDYIGGRSKSVNSDGSINVPIGDLSNVPIEMGSEWLYEDDNEFFHYLDRKGFLQHADTSDKTDFFLSPDTSKIFYQSTGDDGIIMTQEMDKAESDELRERVWEGFIDFRQELLYNGQDQSYFSK